MEKAASNPYSTSGGGFRFENMIGAYYLGCMLTRKLARGFRTGLIQAVGFQTGWAGYEVDDIIVKANDEGKEVKMLIQAKHDLRFARSDNNYVKTIHACWNTFANNKAGGFKLERDILAIAVGTYSRNVDKHFQGLLNFALTSNTSSEFFTKISQVGFASSQKRQYLDEIREIITLKFDAVKDEDLWQFLRHMQVMHFDFDTPGSRDLDSCVDNIQNDFDLKTQEARSLFDSICSLAASFSASAGTLDAERLQKELGKYGPNSETNSQILEEELREFLQANKLMADEVNKIDRLPLKQYHVPTKLTRLGIETWDKKDSDVYFEPQWQLEEFLSSIDWYVVIGAPFGSGKSAMVKMLSSRLAEHYLKNPGDENAYIPVLIFLRRGLENVFHQKDLSTVIQMTTLSGKARQNRILLILDGLDEYPGDINALMNTLKELRENYPNLKAFLTSRLKAGIPGMLKIDNYVRLAPFTDRNQVNILFRNYNVSLTYDILESYGLKHEEIMKPLFCWMLAFLYSDQQFKFDFKKTWKQTTIRAVLFLEFIHSTIRGKYRDIAAEYDWTKHYSYEKNSLRVIAALKHLYKDALTDSIVISNLSKFGLENKESELEPILTSYFHLRSSVTREKLIDFIHESFKEYLLAEYYLESILEDKPYRLNVGTPSKETMQFLDGLLEILNEKDPQLWIEAMKKIGTLPQSFMDSKHAKQTLIEHAREHFEDNSIVTMETEISDDEIWKTVSYKNDQYNTFLINKWILLYVLVKFSSTQIVSIDTIGKLISRTSRLVPEHVINLENVKLDSLDLSGSRLEGCNLSKADLSSAKLAGCNLASANLQGTNLSFANLQGCNLMQADLTGAKLAGANVTRVNFSHANLTKVDLSDADISNSDFIEATLTDAHIEGSKVIATTFTDSRLERCSFSRAIITSSMFNNCDLSSSIFLVGDSRRSVFEGSRFKACRFIGSSVDSAISCFFERCDFSKARLTEINHSTFESCRFTRADLTHAGLLGTYMNNCNFLGAKLDGVKTKIDPRRNQHVEPNARRQGKKKVKA